MKDEILKKLEIHLKSIENQDLAFYISKLKDVIYKLSNGLYEGHEDDLIFDLIALGFQDLANQIRKQMYI